MKLVSQYPFDDISIIYLNAEIYCVFIYNFIIFTTFVNRVWSRKILFYAILLTEDEL